MHAPHQAVSQLARADIDVKPDSGAARRCHGGKQLAPPDCFDLRQACAEFALIVHGASHGSQDAFLGLQAEEFKLAAIVMIGVADSAQVGQLFDQCRIHFSTPAVRRCGL